MRKRTAACIALAFSVGVAAPAEAGQSQQAPSGQVAADPQALTSGQAVNNSVGANRHRCHELVTEPGTWWRVEASGSMDTYISVGRGSCSSMTNDVANDDAGGLFDGTNSRLEFGAGGGVYLVKVQGYNGAAGSYRLLATQRGSGVTRGLLPAGDALGPWRTPGWTPDSVSSSPSNNGEALSPGNVFKDCADVCPELVVVPAGSFTMGSPPEEAGRTTQEGPRHPVAFRNAFAIGRHEVTFEQYDACVAAGGCSYRPNDQGWGRGRRPVVDVSWNDAMAYAAWLSERTGKRYTLPSEAEWEYAARAGTNTPWYTGRAILTDDANILNAFAKTVPVGAYAPNAFGLHDVHGNVSEWTLDCMDTGYVGVPNDGSAATSGDCASKRVLRGGGFSVEPTVVRSANRYAEPQANRFPQAGFRVARAL